MNVFNVILMDFNRKELRSYDVLPYFRKEYKECDPDERPHTRDEWKEFVKSKGMYRFWARCEYEIVIYPWPESKDEEKRQKEGTKIDAWDQINNNLDVVVDLLMSEFIEL